MTDHKKPTVYVASAFGNKSEVKLVQNKLIEMGYVLSHDWSNNTFDGLEGQALEDYRERCSDEDVLGVFNSDLLFMIQHGDGCASQSEMGMAIAWGKPVIIIHSDRKQNIFAHLKSYNFPRMIQYTSSLPSHYHRVHRYILLDAGLEMAKRMISASPIAI